MITLKTILFGVTTVSCPAPVKEYQFTAQGVSDHENFATEYGRLLRHYGQVQLRCSEVIATQAREITQLQSEVMRLRAEVMVSVTRLAFEREERAALEDVLVAADWVICQTGCVSHDAYWRVEDHCKRTGKQCVLVDQATAIKVKELVSS